MAGNGYTSRAEGPDARQRRTLSSRVFARGGAAMRPKSVRASTVAALSKQFDYLEKKVALSRRLCPVRGDGRHLHANFTTSVGKCFKKHRRERPRGAPPGLFLAFFLGGRAGR